MQRAKEITGIRRLSWNEFLKSYNFDEPFDRLPNGRYFLIVGNKSATV